MSERDEIPESDFECPGCSKQFNGPWSLHHHMERCQKALLLVKKKAEVCSRCGGWGWIDADPEYSGDCPECKP